MALPSPEFGDGTQWDGTSKVRPDTSVYKAPDGDLGNRHSSEILSLEELLKDAFATLEILSAPGDANTILGVKSDVSGLEYKELVEGSGITITHATGNVTIASSGGLPALGSANELLGVNNGADDVEYKELVEGDNITITHGTGNITINAAGGGGGGGTTFEATNANAGTIVIGTPVYVSAAGSVDEALADAVATKDVVGLVVDTNIASSATGDIQTGGLLTATTGQWDAVTGDTGGLTAGTQYFVDPDTAGMLTDTASITIDDFICPVGIALSTTEMIIAIHQTVKL
jgi:hypothetical protein